MIKTIIIRAHRWFDKTWGNTYFAARATDALTGETLAQIPFEYGYGDHYADCIMREVFKNHPELPQRIMYENGGGEAPWVWSERTGIRIEKFVSDGLKRDMKGI